VIRSDQWQRYGDEKAIKSKGIVKRSVKYKLTMIGKLSKASYDDQSDQSQTHEIRKQSKVKNGDEKAIKRKDMVIRKRSKKMYDDQKMNKYNDMRIRKRSKGKG
jgi:hypothetical protein